MEALLSSLEVAMDKAPARRVEDDDPPLIGRGVFTTPWRYRGTRWIFAVDSTHDVVHMEPILLDADRDALVAKVRAILDDFDPQPIRAL